MKLPEKLIQLRREKGYSQEQLADLLGVSRQSVSKWEAGQSTPELAKLLTLADLFGVTLDALIREEQPVHPPAAPDPPRRPPSPVHFPASIAAMNTKVRALYLACRLSTSTSDAVSTSQEASSPSATLPLAC